METTLKTIINKDWITLLLVLSFLVLVIGKFFYTQQFQGLLPFLGSDKYTTRTKDKKALHPFTVLLSIHQITIFSLFLFLWYSISLGKEYTQLPDLYIKILIGYLAFEVVKTLIDKIIGYLLNVQGVMQLYLNRKLNFKNLLSILVLILCFYVVYSDFVTIQLLQISLWSIVGLYFISLAITISKYQDQILSLPSYFILYFCTLEIAPYYILYHIAT
ncbi:DUF4271 domain-containing protein [Dokdonia pacifica]|uniref:DUF4271 domain-containing protein n=1 Tax=Dokdonia pacifica TaxID=1627892 RepID=A0A238VYS7_9FLAO|nr:DUF4271 domain-containing protein [Dokdonia pacifica]GGG16406.1 DUF4271 domain-containing protein [Dokdonia pacifica]SNR39462.1 protein of unknown function [Dokdonia pacifica]